MENYLLDYDKIIITVSHDRHFLNKVCTHTVDIDYAKVKLYSGNYDFWRESSELAQRLMLDSNKKKEEKIKALQAFIARFSANASKSSQATSRKKSLEKINLDEIVPSSRKYPYIGFDIARNLGKDVLTVENLSASYLGEKVFENVSFRHKNTNCFTVRSGSFRLNFVAAILPNVSHVRCSPALIANIGLITAPLELI